MGKGEIARHEQFLLFPLCFQKTCNTNTSKNQGLFGRASKLRDSQAARRKSANYRGAKYTVGATCHGCMYINANYSFRFFVPN